MLAYWQNNVAENFLPPISVQKKMEIEMRKIENEPLKVKKETVKRIKSAQKHASTLINEGQNATGANRGLYSEDAS